MGFNGGEDGRRWWFPAEPSVAYRGERVEAGLAPADGDFGHGSHVSLRSHSISFFFKNFESISPPGG